MPSTKTILIVEDEPKISDLIRSYLEQQGYCAAIAASGPDALLAFEQSTPALVILDLMLPGMSGEEVCRAIRKRSRVPILMLTAKVEEEDILKGLAIGADDYVTKPFSPRQLMARVDALLRRVSAEPMPLASLLSFDDGALVADSLRHEIRKNGRPVQLTPNEFKILMALLTYPTRTFTRDDLIRLAFSDDFNGYDRIIDTHIKNIRQKIEDDPKMPRYVLTVHGVGYKFGGDRNEV